MSSEAVVSAHEVSKIYEPHPFWMRVMASSPIKQPVVALDGVSFQVGRGQICAIVGPNGAGKSTLFRVLTGLTTPSSGSATIAGLDVETQSQQVRRVLGVMPPEDRSLFLRQTCRENLMFNGRLRGMNRQVLRQRIDVMLELVGLAAARDRAASALSSGMRTRLMLARALLHQPPVLILDEPTSQLDPVAAYDLVETIRRIAAEEGTTVLLSSHRLEEIEALGENVMLLNKGRLVFRGDMETLRDNWDRPQIHIRFEGKDAAVKAASLLKEAKGVEIIDLDPPLVRARSEAGTAGIFSALDGQISSIRSLQQTRTPLREVLVAILNASEESRGDRS